jgi:Txe/YoeB family toxin of Txe-Axe toxin-antitoxin module
MSNQDTLKRDFKNGSHWLRFWPVITILVGYGIGGVAFGAALKADVINLKDDKKTVDKKIDRLVESVAQIPYMDQKMNKLQEDFNSFQREQRQVNNEILRSIRSQ